MAQHGIGQRPDVFDSHVVAAPEDGAHLAAEQQVLRGAQPGSPPDPVLDKVERFGIAGPGTPHQIDGKLGHVVRHVDLLDQPLEGQDVLAREHRIEVRLVVRGRLHRHGQLIFSREIVDDDVEHEAVELGLGQGVGAFEFDGVLGSHDEERLFQLKEIAAGGHLIFLHRFEQRRLRLRRGAVDLVGEHHICKDRPLYELKGTLAGLVVFLDDFGAGDVARHQVRGKLNAVELQVEGL